MKSYSTSYSVEALDYSHGLYTYSETVEGLCREIDESNDEAFKLGYKKTQWLITKTQLCFERDDVTGEFISRHIDETVVMKYPVTIDENFYNYVAEEVV